MKWYIDFWSRVSFEFQHNVCGRSIYAEGTVDAAVFLFKKVWSTFFFLFLILHPPSESSVCYIILITLMQVRSKAEQRIYDMIDVLREGNMRWSALFISHFIHSRGWIWPVLDEEILFLTACGHPNFGEICWEYGYIPWFASANFALAFGTSRF